MAVNPSRNSSFLVSVDYYDRNAEAFFRDTVAADVGSLRSRFLAYVRPSGTILDAGCGSGRDALAFSKSGYDVTAFDASKEMVRLARMHTNLQVMRMTFDDIPWVGRFDGIWANASLLHVPKVKLPETLKVLERALREKGALFVSVKYGSGERSIGGRTFTDLTEDLLANMIENSTRLRISDLWTSCDVRPGRAQERWLSAISIKETWVTTLEGEAFARFGLQAA